MATVINKAAPSSPPASMPSSTWVDRMRMVPQSSDQSTSSAAAAQTQTGSKSLEFNIASFNVLAESYLTPRSHPGLPEQYANVAFNTTKRRQLLLDTLQRFCCSTDSDSSKRMDILALQELDLVQPNDDHPILPALEEWGYGVVRTSSKQRKDCCAIVYDRSKFSLVKSEVINFDDLATLHININNDNVANNTGKGDDGDNDKATAMNFHNVTNKRTNNTQPELTGMVRSFLRRNCAILAHLKSIETQQSIICTSVHLYWNPSHEYVKLCQAKYLLDRVETFASSSSISSVEKSDDITASPNGDSAIIQRVPVVVCGDMNSKPGSAVHQLFVKSNVDARSIAPWRYFWDRDTEEMYTEDPIPTTTDSPVLVEENGGYMMENLSSEFSMFCGVIEQSKPNENVTTKNASTVENGETLITAHKLNGGLKANDDLKATLEWRRLHNHKTPQDYQHTMPPSSVMYILDYTLNRFTRWLRILGIDATLETLEEEKERTSGGNIALFDHCKNEQRTLITTSKNLLLRKDCPPGAYLLDPKSTAHLEKALPRLLRTHGVKLSPCTFLTRCVVCNGHINRVTTYEEIKAVFHEHGCPDWEKRDHVDEKDDMEVFRCDSCGQGYWWDDAPSSSASRVFTQATKLFKLCLNGGVRVKDEGTTDEKERKVIMGAFAFVDVAKERQQIKSTTNETNELAVIEWLREEKLSNPFKLQSVYAAENDTTKSSLPFTNVTKEFVGCLDYVFFEKSHIDEVCKLHVPTSFRDMNGSGSNQGHLIPSDIWPSDHIAVGARLRLKSNNNNAANKTIGSETVKPITHDSKCGCGCVPQIMSLFEMAELRKKLREEKKAKSKALKEENLRL